jgi:flagellar protein FlbT
MSLKVQLKPGERIILGAAVVTNGPSRTRLTVDGDVPILREKDIMTAEAADTAAKRIYLAVQLMYLARNPTQHHAVYFELLREFMEAVPSSMPILDAINQEILTGAYYKALRAAKDLIAHEAELITHAQRDAGLRQNGTEDSQPS